jgi:glucose-6-phosphate isomerase
MNINLDISKVLDFVTEEKIFSFEKEIIAHHRSLFEKTGKGNEYLGWLTLPSAHDQSIIKSIKDDAERLGQMVDIYVVVGIGGSYLGARAVIESLENPFNYLRKNNKTPHIVYAGHHISEDYMHDLIEILNEKDYALAVISKSGTTTEPAIAFRLIKAHLEKKYGKAGARERIIAITDKSKGALKTLSTNEGYKTYIVPDDVGGRYSVLTPVGLLPIAVAGYDIEKLLEGAALVEKLNFTSSHLEKNPAALYAASRNALYRNGKSIEILVNYLPSLFYFTEWWKQLYGESEGKEQKGIFPAGVSFTTDLHSMGQYIQEGLRIIFETVLSVKETKGDLEIPYDGENLDGLNYIAGKKLQEVNRMATLGTMIAHADGGVPIVSLEIPALDEFNIGQLIYFFEVACALSGYLLGVNPFDQPGVEAYKKNMFALLGKPGYEHETEKIKKKLNNQIII